MSNRQSFIANIRRAYSRRYKTVLLSSTTFLITGSILLIIFRKDPTSPLSQICLNIGAALLTGVVFSLVLPIFLSDSEEGSALSPTYLYELATNRFLGLGRVWTNEDTFHSDFDLRQKIRENPDSEYIFLGISLTRFFETYGHVLEAVYSSMLTKNWKPCFFFIADPESEYVKAHISSPYGRKDTIDDIGKTIKRYDEIRTAIAKARGCAINEVPLYLYLTSINIRFGLIYFSDSFSIITLYRFGSRSYFNPRIELLHNVPETNQASPLGKWIDDYVNSLKGNSKLA